VGGKKKRKKGIKDPMFREEKAGIRTSPSGVEVWCMTAEST